MQFFSSFDVMSILQAINNAIKARPGVNNSVVSRDRQPTLGPSFAFLTDLTLWLSKCDPNGAGDDRCRFKAEVLRSRKMVDFIFFICVPLSDGLSAH